jgi:hypothetical protein
MRSPVDVVLEADTSFHVPTSLSFLICAKDPALYETKSIRRFRKSPTEELPWRGAVVRDVHIEDIATVKIDARTGYIHGWGSGRCAVCI